MPGVMSYNIPTLDEAEDFVLKELQDNDLLITMGAGDVWKLGVKLAEKLTTFDPGGLILMEVLF